MRRRAFAPVGPGPPNGRWHVCASWPCVQVVLMRSASLSRAHGGHIGKACMDSMTLVGRETKVAYRRKDTQQQRAGLQGEKPVKAGAAGSGPVAKSGPVSYLFSIDRWHGRWGRPCWRHRWHWHSGLWTSVASGTTSLYPIESRRSSAIFSGRRRKTPVVC